MCIYCTNISVLERARERLTGSPCELGVGWALMAFDDDFGAAAVCAALSDDDGPGDAVAVADKPGFGAWASALTSRNVAEPSRACIGYWDADLLSVVLVQARGKKQLVMGRSERSRRLLRPEEALYLLDDGHLLLLAAHPETGADLRPGITTSASRARMAHASAAAAVGAPEPTLPASAATAPSRAATSWRNPDDEFMGEAAAPAPSLLPQAPMATPMYLSLPASYEFLLRFVPLGEYLVYLHLRSMGLIALRHCAAPAPAAGAAAPPAAPPATLLYTPGAGVAPERDFVPVYDVYARDGISTFKLATPGPPDFYVCVAAAEDTPPSPTQIARMDMALAWHMAALRAAQLSRGVAAQPSFNELGGGGGSNVAPNAHMHRAPGAVAAAADAASFSPNVKIAIVSHTTLTFYSVTPVELRVPRRYAAAAAAEQALLRRAAAAAEAPSAAVVEEAKAPVAAIVP